MIVCVCSITKCHIKTKSVLYISGNLQSRWRNTLEKDIHTQIYSFSPMANTSNLSSFCQLWVHNVVALCVCLSITLAKYIFIQKIQPTVYYLLRFSVLFLFIFCYSEREERKTLQSDFTGVNPLRHWQSPYSIHSRPIFFRLCFRCVKSSWYSIEFSKLYTKLTLCCYRLG